MSPVLAQYSCHIKDLTSTCVMSSGKVGERRVPLCFFWWWVRMFTVSWQETRCLSSMNTPTLRTSKQTRGPIFRRNTSMPVCAQTEEQTHAHTDTSWWLTLSKKGIYTPVARQTWYWGRQSARNYDTSEIHGTHQHIHVNISQTVLWNRLQRNLIQHVQRKKNHIYSFTKRPHTTVIFYMIYND